MARYLLFFKAFHRSHTFYDTYVFGSNDGQDTIFDESGHDKILFTASIDKNNILFSYEDDDLVLNYGNSNASIRIQNATEHSIESIELSNGEYITNNDINNIVQQMNAYAIENEVDMTNA